MRSRAIALAGAAALVCAWAVPAAADSWDEKTILKFDKAVMIPGATLQPGTYVFQIGDETTARHTIRITRENDSHVIATVPAIPMRRLTANNDIVLQFDATDQGAAPAVKGWFYPGRLYGHEFIYPEEQARHIAERAHTLVLADDTQGEMSGKGTLHVVDAQGARTDRHPDDALTREWDTWNRGRHHTSAAGSGASHPDTASPTPGASSSTSAGQVR